MGFNFFSWWSKGIEDATAAGVKKGFFRGLDEIRDEVQAIGMSEPVALLDVEPVAKTNGRGRKGQG